MNNLQQFDKFKDMHLMEKQRFDSFREWPFKNHESCSIEKMSEAGFYWSGTKVEPDTATCFVCDKTLDGWEADDDPWKEHEKHAPQCLFAKYKRKESDLTVGEFLKIFGVVIQNRITKNLNQKTKELRRLASKEVDTFSKTKFN